MNIIEIRESLSTSLITHEQLESLLRGRVSNINAKIAYMVKKGELLRLKRGVYLLGEPYRTTPADTLSIANILYAPSYVSFEYALSYYGLIPERVYEVTSATMRLKKLFETPLGRYSYRPVPVAGYALGVDWLYDRQNGGRLIATPEKALCDKIRADRGIGKLSQRKLREYLEEDLRIEAGSLETMDAELILAIADAYRSTNLRNLAKLVGKRRESA